MPLTEKAVRAVYDKFPKAIDARTHAIIDYVMLGTFVTMGAMFWRNNKRASMGAFLCGAAAGMNSMLTDYPGGITPAISFETHGKIDAGLAGLTAGTPSIMAFGDDPEAKYFRLLAVAETAVTALTNFEQPAGKVVEMPLGPERREALP